MPKVRLTLNGIHLEVERDLPLIHAARQKDIYIPGLCFHPDLPPAEACGLCLVEIDGRAELAHACQTLTAEGLTVTTDSPRLRAARQKQLSEILARHPHACLTCAQQEGCSREPCSTSVPVAERCCPELGRCEIQKVAAFIGIAGDTKKWTPTSYPRFVDEPLIARDYNLCIGCTRCVRACNDLRGIGALTTKEIEPGITIAWARNDTLVASGCKFCGACVEVCPTGALTDKTDRAGRREDVLVPCGAACPAGIDVPRYVQLIAEGKPELAARVIRQKVPFPAVLGHACFHPCEHVCRRGELNEPIAICALKRFAAESDPGPTFRPRSPRPHKVAVIGAGPAGLTAAFTLAGAGHPTTLFEAMPEPGGMLRYGAPPYRLPRETVDADLRHILSVPGLELRCNTVSPSPKLLRRQGYHAVVVACGTWKSKSLGVEGMSLDGLALGGDFLRDRALGKLRGDRLAGRKIVVLGGGNVAIDCARTALRLAASSVDIVCLEPRAQMPAHDEEIADVEAEGARIHDGWGPARFRGDGERLTGVELKRCTRVFDEVGHFSPRYNETETRSLEADFAILAIGLEGQLKFCRDDDELRITKWASIEADEQGATSEPGVFAAGDIVTGPRSIVEAVAAGRQAAASVLRYLEGDAALPEEPIVELPAPEPFFGEEASFVPRPREAIAGREPAERLQDFDPVELGYDAEQARREARRCLRCDMRLRLNRPILPPEPWLALTEQNVCALPECEGVYQLLDAGKKVIAIKGTPNVRADLLEKLEEPSEARFFLWEAAPMYTQRESELIQRHLQTYGELPTGGDDDLDELF